MSKRKAREYTKDDAIRELWRRGDLGYKLRPHQRDFYASWHDFNATRQYSKSVWEMHRQGGKSHTLLTTFVGAATRQKLDILYGTYSYKATRQILRPRFAKIIDDVPAHLKPRWVASEGQYLFPNGSVITLAGFDDGRAEDYRGRTQDVVVVDEGGFIADLMYIVKSILFPMLKETRGNMVIASTPPKTPGHDFTALALEAESEGLRLVRTIDHDTSVTPQTLAAIEKECGGRDSVTFRREYLCQHVVDQSVAVLPEFTDEAARVIVQEPAVPPYFIPLVGMDVGFRDWTAVLFGYYDFKAAKLTVQDEIFVRQNEMTTDRLAKLIKDKETGLWSGKQVDNRVSDTDLILIHDLSALHGLVFAPTAKDDKEAQVNELRIWTKLQRLTISPKCVNLIRHMKTAIWNKTRSGFERSSDGHADGVDALIYMLRNAPITVNPYPALGPDVDIHTHMIPARNEPLSSNAVTLGGLFKRKFG